MKRTPLQAISKESLIVRGLTQLTDLHKSFSEKAEKILSVAVESRDALSQIKKLPKGDKGDSIKGDRGEKGDKGEDGYTPKKGKDYFDGKDGNQVDPLEVAQLATSLITTPKDGKDAPSLEVIAGAIVERLKTDDILGIDKKITGIRTEVSSYRNQLAMKQAGQHGGGDTVAAGTNVTITTNAAGAKVINATGGGGGSVQTVTGLNTDNTDPANPIVKISVDGTTITGAGTPGSPLVATGGGGGTPGGLNAQLQYNNAGSFGGITGATTDGTAVSLNAAHLLNPTINGAGAGLATLVYPNTASNATITVPATTGTLALTSQLTAGTVTSVDVSGGTTGLTTSGGPVTTTGVITLGGTLAIANGGTNNISAYTAGSVVYSDGTKLTQDNANFFYDATNHRLGIGTTTPNAQLDILSSTYPLNVGSTFVESAGPSLGVYYTASGDLFQFAALSNIAYLNAFPGKAINISANGFSNRALGLTVDTSNNVTIGTLGNGLVKSSSGLLSNATAGTDYQSPISLTTTGTSGNATFTSNTLNIPNYTYTLPTASTSVLGGVKVDGTSITISGGVISATTGGSGTVTSVASADGSITVTNPTTTVDLAVVKAPIWSTARLLAGNSVNGSANVAFANKFIVQGTTDTGLSGAQFLGALGTGIVKNTTSTGVLSIAVAGTDYVIPGANSNITSLTGITGAISSPTSLTFTGVAPPTYAQGKLVYDTDNESLTFFNNDSAVGLQIGQESWIRVINKTGSTIANGAAVYISGSDATSGLQTIALARANAAATVIGAGLTTESIANNAIGYVTAIGVVHGLDTSGFAAGATVYISSATAGLLTSTAPAAPNYRYRIGIVGIVSATVGTINVTPSTAALGNGTANQVFGMNSAGTAQEVKSIVGTADRLTITHTTNTITANIAATYVGQSSITTLGTITTGVWNGTAIANANLVNSAVTIGSTSVSLGATSTTLAGLTSVSSTAFVGALTGNASTATALQTARTIGTITGDATSAGSSFDGTANNTNALTLATVNSNVGSFTNASITVNAKGLITAASNGSAGAVSSVSNADGTLTISPTTGAVVASLALSHANTWTGAQTFGADLLIATSPKITTNIHDTNGNAIIGLTATTSATTFVQIANSAGGAPLVTTSSGSVPLILSGGRGVFQITGDGTSSASEALQLNIPGGSAATLSTLGTNQDLVITPNGTGQIKFGKNASPNASDGAALGTTSLQWSDLFLASGGVINWANGNATLTQSSGLLTSNVPLSLGTSNSLTAGTIEVGAATDTTIARVSAGVISVEGVTVDTISATNTLTNKRVTRRTTTVTQSATPTINSDNMDVAAIAGLAQAITSMTTNLTGTPVQNDFLEIQITDNGTARAITWGASFSSGGLVNLPTTTVISTRLRVLLEWDAASKWTCVAVA